MKAKEIIPWIVVGFLLALLIAGGIYAYLEYNKAVDDSNTVQYWEKEGFITAVDSIMDKRYEELNPTNKTYNITVPEKVIEHYVKEDVPINRELALLADSLIFVNDSLNRAIAQINQSYITRYPFNPKLIAALFSSDTLKLDLLNTDGTISSHLWIPDYSRYKYKWSMGSLTTVRLPELKKSKKFIRQLEHHLFTHAGYDFPLQAGYIQGDYYVSWRKFTFATHLGATLERTPKLEGRIGLGYKPF